MHRDTATLAAQRLGQIKNNNNK